jgi:hypothetical protein
LRILKSSETMIQLFKTFSFKFFTFEFNSEKETNPSGTLSFSKYPP